MFERNNIMKNHMRKVLIILIAFAVTVSSPIFLSSVHAEEAITKSTVGEMKAAALDQKLIVSVKGKTVSLTMKDLSKMPLDLYGDNGTFRDAVVTDMGLLGTFFQKIEKKAGDSMRLKAETKVSIVTAIQQTVVKGTTDDLVFSLTEDHFEKTKEEKKEEQREEKQPTEERPNVLAVLSPEIAPAYQIQGSCTTSFKGSTANRKKNIAIAAANLNGLVLEPGASFSVSEQIKPRTSANGYRTAGTYEAGKIVQAMGGGICQASSTTYNAAMNSGLTILERHQHSMPVHYLPLGLDAAISSGSKDLKIRNDYVFPVVFEAYTKGNNLTVNVYTDQLQMNGYSFRFHSVKKGSLSANSYLEISKDGRVTEDRFVASSKYMPLSE